MKTQYYVVYKKGNYDQKVYRMSDRHESTRVSYAQQYDTAAEALQVANDMNDAIPSIQRPWNVLAK